MEDEEIASVGRGRTLCLYTMLEYCVMARQSAHTDWISCMNLAQYTRLPFCALFYIGTTYYSLAHSFGTYFFAFFDGVTYEFVDTTKANVHILLRFVGDGSGI